MITISSSIRKREKTCENKNCEKRFPFGNLFLAENPFQGEADGRVEHWRGNQMIIKTKNKTYKTYLTNR